MAKRNRAELETLFADNAIPTGASFAELIESSINQNDDGIRLDADKNIIIQPPGGAGELQLQSPVNVTGNTEIDGNLSLSGALDSAALTTAAVTVNGPLQAGDSQLGNIQGAALRGDSLNLTGGPDNGQSLTAGDSLIDGDLNVQGDLSLRDTLAVGERIHLNNPDPASHALIDLKRNLMDGTRNSLAITSAGGNSQLVLKGNGELGLGNAAPEAMLHITNDGNGHALRVDDKRSDLTPFVIDLDGRAGLGTDKPQAALHLKAPSSDDAFRIETAEGNPWFRARAGQVNIDAPLDTGELSVEGDTLLNGNLHTTGNSRMDKGLSLNQGVADDHALAVTGSVLIDGDTRIDNALHVGENPIDGVMFGVRGNSQLAGDLTVDGTLNAEIGGASCRERV